MYNWAGKNCHPLIRDNYRKACTWGKKANLGQTYVKTWLQRILTSYLKQSIASRGIRNTSHTETYITSSLSDMNIRLQISIMHGLPLFLSTSGREILRSACQQHFLFSSSDVLKCLAFFSRYTTEN